MAVTNQLMTKPVRRKASKDVRRRQLIEATIDSIAKRGFAATTMADVADGAGLSRGIVNFHFESKEKLLAETLRFMVSTYSAHWRKAISASGPGAAQRFWALLEADFDRKVCNRRSIAAWAGLRAEAQSRPIYRRICGHHDNAFKSTIEGLCAELVEDGGYGAEPGNLASGFEAMLEGLWLQVLMNPNHFSRQHGRDCAQQYLVMLFPKHFTKDGPIDRKS